MMRDYWLSKLFYDLQSAAVASEFRSNPEAVTQRYALSPEVKEAIKRHDVPMLAERTNAYLLRYYFFAVGMKDDEFIARLRHG